MPCRLLQVPGLALVLWSSVVSVGCRHSAAPRGDPPEAAVATAPARDASAATPLPAGVVATATGGWVRRLGGPGDTVIADVAVEPGGAGQLYVAGYFGETIDLGGDALASAGGDEAFVAAYSGDGQHRWSTRVGGPGGDRGEALLVEPDGGVLLLGCVSGRVDLGGGAVAEAERWTGALSSFTDAGALRWSRAQGGGATWPTALARAADRGVLVAGAFEGTLPSGASGISSRGSGDGFVSGVGADGAARFTRTFGGEGDDGVSDVAAGAAGGLVVVGSFEGTLELDRGHRAQSAGARDAFVAGLSPLGEVQWVRTYGAEGWDSANAVVTDPAGNAYVVGQIRRPGTYHGGRPTFYDDVLVASLAPDGTERWVRRVETRVGSGDDATWVGAGLLCLTGTFSATIDFGGEELASAMPESVAAIPGGGEPPTDAFVACLDATGVRRWSTRLGGMGDEHGTGIAAWPDGALLVGGTFEGTTEIDGAPLTSAGGSDGFVLRLVPPRARGG